jgi:transglutaminase-like putative cysteine protease
MRLGLAHEGGLLLATTLAYLIVLLGGEFPLVAWLVLGTPFVSAWLRSRGTAAPAGSGTALGAAALALGVAQVASAGIDAAVLGGGVALIGLLTARLLTRQTLDHDLQALLLTLLLVLAGSVLNVGLNYGVIFVCYAIAAVWALTTRQLLSGAASAGVGDAEATLDAVKTRRDVVTPAFLTATGGVALFVLATTGLVFVAFPRIGIGNFGMKSQRGSDFPSAVSLRGNPRASVGSTDIVARVTGVTREAFIDGLYLRGGVYDTLDEDGFGQASQSPKLKGAERLHAAAPQTGRYTVFLRPIAGELLFTLGGLTNAIPLAGGKANPSFKMTIPGTNARGELVASDRLQSAMRYEVRGGWARVGHVPTARRRPTHLDKDPAARAFFLEVPDGLRTTVAPLVAQLTEGKTTAADKAEALRTYLLDNFVYTLQQPSGGAAQPLVHFLTKSRAGHCEYFATAYSAMLRAAGIPSRVIGGYQGGKWDEANQTAVFYGYNAHAWVEWYLDDAGWVTDDPTPTATAERGRLSTTELLFERIQRFWDDSVLDYALSNQLDALRDTRNFFSRLSTDVSPTKVIVVVVTVLAVVGLFFALRRSRRRDDDDDDRVHPVAEALVIAIEQVSGAPVAPASTLREAAEALPADDDRVAIVEVLAAYEADRFGAVRLSPARIEAAVRRLGVIAERARQRRAEGESALPRAA